VLALLGMGTEHADLSIALKQPPPLWQILVTGAALIVLVIGPYTEETIRCAMAQRMRLPVGFKPAE
jgi:hypothetical protein